MNTTKTTMDLHHNHSHMNHMSTNQNHHKAHNHGEMNKNTESEHQMMMVMHAGYREIIVFPGWKTDSISNLIGSCIALMMIAVAYEALKLFRDKMTEKNLRKRKRQKFEIQEANNKTEDFTIQDKHTKNQTYKEKLFSLEHLFQTLMHILQFSISYFLMLAFMTYNYWLCLSILVGIGIGFFLFGVRRNKIDLNEDCH